MSKPAMAECPSCDGFGDHGLDEQGCVYACYFCGMTGRVLASVAAEFRRDEAWGRFLYAERAIRQRVALGVPFGASYRIDQETGEAILIPPPRPTAMATAGWSTDDDIPF